MENQVGRKRGESDKGGFKLGEEPAKIHEPSIRRAYESVLSHAARVVSFSTSKRFEDQAELSRRQVNFLLDDIVSFSLSARRLISEANFVELARNVTVPTYMIHTNQTAGAFRIEGSLPMSRVLNIIIHNELMEVLRGTRDIYRMFGPRIKSTDDIVKYVQLENVDFIPKLLIKSDISEASIIEIAAFMEIFLNEIVDGIIDICEDRGIYLDEAGYY